MHTGNSMQGNAASWFREGGSRHATETGGPCKYSMRSNYRCANTAEYNCGKEGEGE